MLVSDNENCGPSSGQRQGPGMDGSILSAHATVHGQSRTPITHTLHASGHHRATHKQCKLGLHLQLVWERGCATMHIVFVVGAA